MYQELLMKHKTVQIIQKKIKVIHISIYNFL